MHISVNSYMKFVIHIQLTGFASYHTKQILVGLKIKCKN